jgi:octaprenyl-diphosphate synthase
MNNNNFLEILEVLKPDLAKIDDIIKHSTDDRAKLIFDVTNYLVLGGGKRIRPILLVIAARLCGYEEGNRHYNLGAAIELIHSATLLHDDVVDNSYLRRSQKTINAIWDNKAAILVGDYLFSAAFELMTRDGSLEVLKLLSNASATMADGEVLQLMNSTNIDISYQQYLEIISSKTAILFSAATEVGAVVANKGREEILALREFGKNLGVIFQITDDILDYSTSQKILGKDIGDDFFDSKITLPIIIAYQKADKSDQDLIKDLFAKNLIESNKNYDNFNLILSLIAKYQAIQDSIAKALFYKELCIKNLDLFPNSKHKDYLLTIVDYCLKRVL